MFLIKKVPSRFSSLKVRPLGAFSFPPRFNVLRGRTRPRFNTGVNAGVFWLAKWDIFYCFAILCFSPPALMDIVLAHLP